ncbi:chemotaxis protein CheW [Paenibacillus sp. YPG26]|uniref:chemotaxis protein CheW n=1 Tax=Paenibacillus sp. YPG26 TaxID=2878915 RepID=UPI00203B918B|nr:chemotaxis protein CheW [Paenibacillus sp. YPG26]USB31753.1 chemotaxis protein CheW [Paenibacillus sp. YPG26]
MTVTSQIGGVQFVVFSINSQLYSLSIEEVVEILRVPSITSVPGISEVIEGVINLRGSIIPVVNMHKRFNLPLPTKHKKNRVVIVQGDNENIGLMVEEVSMVTKFDEDDVEPMPGQALEEDMFLGFAKNEGQVIGVLNLNKVLYDHHDLS